MQSILLVLISICSVTWFVWPFVFIGTLTGLLRRAVCQPAETAQV